MNPAPTEHLESSTPRKPWRHLAFIAAVTLTVGPVALGFDQTRDRSKGVHLVGAVLAMGLAVACASAFLRCPRRPVSVKVAALLLTVPSLFLALATVMRFYTFWWK